MASSFLRRANPYNPRYAMPGYVLAEPPRRAVTSPKMPRGWGGGPNVKVGLMMSRGYADGHLPPDLAGLGSLSGPSQATSGPDPIAKFGQQAAQVILARTGNNVVRVRAALAKVSSSLVPEFDRKVAGGMRVEGALAAVLANRLLARAAGGNASLGDVAPPPGTAGAGAGAGVAPVQWSAAAKAIIDRYLAANPGATANSGVYTGGAQHIVASDKKAFYIRPVNLVGADLGTYRFKITDVREPLRLSIQRGTYPFTPAGSGLLKSYNPSTRTLQLKSVSTDLFTLTGQAVKAVVKKGVNLVEDLVDKIGDLACSAVNSSVASTAVVLGTGSAGAAGVAAAQAKCAGGGGYQGPPVQEQSSSNTGIILAVAAGAAVLLLAGRRGK